MMNRSSKQTRTKKVQPQKADSQPKKGWEWAAFTKKSYDFTQAARALSDALKSEYGDNVSISQFEKMIAAIPSMTDAQRGLIHLDHKTVDLLKVYRSARASRDSERDNFRGDIQIGNVDTGLEALGGYSIVIGEGGQQEKEKKEE